MKFQIRFGWLALLLGASAAMAQTQLRTVQATTPNGVVEGVVSADNKVRTYKGIPYAAPPVGALRWKAPQPPVSWTGVRKSTEYGARCMQGPIYSDMIFHDSGPSEDCLYLNLWMPEEALQGKPMEQVKLPVMVWIYGGGFAAGSSSEPRQDAGNLSKKGVMVVSMNYRLGIFGFFSHPELAKESGHNASGNYGLMDQLAALKWVHDNIAIFGGDPENVTIFGESAGSFSVSALMATPLSKGLFKRAIGESGAFFSSTLPLKTEAESEKLDVDFAKTSLGTDSLAELRAKPADEVLQAALKAQQLRFAPNIDGYYLAAPVSKIFAEGKQAHVPLLAGWNRDESNARSFLGRDEANLENFKAHAATQFGPNAAKFLKAYAAPADADVKRAAQDYATDQFIAFGTWKWIEMQNKTGKSPVYRYQFDQPLPLAPNASPNAEPTVPHAAEIEFVFLVLNSRKLPWTADDRKVSDMVATYWTNFAKTGDPNGGDLPKWPVYTSKDSYPVMHLSTTPEVKPEQHRARYEFLDSLAK